MDSVIQKEINESLQIDEGKSCEENYAMKEIAKMIRMCKGIATSSLEERAKREVCLGPSKFKKTLIFDLDETLIHAQAKVVYKSQRKVQEID